MDTAIRISKNPPRDFDLAKIPFNKGLIPWFFFGCFFSIAPYIPLIVYITMNTEKTIPMLPFFLYIFIFDMIGVFLLVRAIKRRNSRINSLVKGTAVTAHVVSHDRAFVFWKSSRDYTITLEFTSDGTNHTAVISSSNETLHHDHPITSEITGFYDGPTKTVFFPAEIGVVFELR